MKIISWNVNGIRAVIRKDAIVPLFETEQPDILCIQETKAQPEQVSFDVEGYEQFWNSAEKKGYSGTAVYTKLPVLSVVHDIPPEIEKKNRLSADKYGDPNTEGRVMTLEFEDFYLVTVYTPNAKDDLTRIPLREKWDAAFADYMIALEIKKPVIFCGDLNVAHTEEDLARPKENIGKKGFTNEERSGFERFISDGFVDTFRMFHQGNGHYSWWSNWGQARERNVGWRIDYFMVSSKLKDKVKSADILMDVMGSDHAPVVVEIS